MSKEIAFKRLFGRTFVCMKCNAKMRSTNLKVKAGKVQCRKCGSRKLRNKSKESRG